MASALGALAGLRLGGENGDHKGTWDAACRALRGNVRELEAYRKPLLWEGSTYQGVWQECGPHEALVYYSLRDHMPPEDSAATEAVARNNHLAFFALQRPDGQLPSSIKTFGLGFGQIQMVVPIAATAWELAQASGDHSFLEQAYAACARWDAWLRKYRDTRKTGLVEGFCTFDTGMDNSSRWAGMPNRCPDSDARKCPDVSSLPRLCPDLSATVYGARLALAAMAKALGKRDEAAKWEGDAEHIRQLIIDKLYCAEDAAFYDLDAQDQFVRVRSVAIHRVLGEHVLKLESARDNGIFDNVWKRQIHNPEAFWTPYPFPSVAFDDPKVVRPIPRNSWGGATQALTALRAPRWMSHYGKDRELKELMGKWCAAIVQAQAFRQQMDPQSGVFTLPDPGGYSPCALVFLDFSRRLGTHQKA